MGDRWHYGRGGAIAKRAARLFPVLALLAGGCGIFSLRRVEAIGPVSVQKALLEARDGNWRIRVTMAGTTLEGRVAFVTDSAARVGGGPVRLSTIERIERWAMTDLGGRPAGALAGGALGALLAGVYRGFWEFGAERECTNGCTLGIFGSWITGTGLVGAMIGSAVHPPHYSWVTVWQRS